MKRRILLARILTFLLLAGTLSCSKDEVSVLSEGTEDSTSIDIPIKYVGLVEELSQKGYNPDSFEYQKAMDVILYEGDIAFGEEHLIRAKNAFNFGAGLVSRANSGDISYFVDREGDDAFPTNYVTPLQEAMQYWNDVHANITITEVDTEAEADIICRRGTNLRGTAFARFPAGNNVGGELLVDNQFNDSFSENENLTLMIHEIGHTLGYTHSDSFAFSHIPNTNTANWHFNNNCGSIMRSSVFPCNWTSENSDWSDDDITAINYIFNDTGDADGDGVITTNEDGADTDPTNDDTDNDGIPDYLDTDDDGDSILTEDEDVNNNNNPMDDDSDEDGIPNYLDDDDDGDGIATANEGSEDRDDDGTPNHLDTDDDNDGILSITEGIIDTDLDDIPNHLDADDDGDGINTVDEDLDNDGDPTNDDTDGDDIPNYLDSDDDGDGIDTITEDSDVNGSGNASDDDTDEDGIPNYLDDDDDGDGINSLTEGIGDSDRDGIRNYLDLTQYYHDFRFDGLNDFTLINDSEEQLGVKSFFNVSWGVRSVISENFTNTTIVRDWIISPIIRLKAGYKVKIRVAGEFGGTSQFELRLSSRGENSTLPAANNGDTTEVGDFDTVLVDSATNIGNWIVFEAIIPNSLGNELQERKLALIHKAAAAGQGNLLDVEYIEVIAE